MNAGEYNCKSMGEKTSRQEAAAAPSILRHTMKSTVQTTEKTPRGVSQSFRPLTPSPNLACSTHPSLPVSTQLHSLVRMLGYLHQVLLFFGGKWGYDREEKNFLSRKSYQLDNASRPDGLSL
mmetsp:Transcript_25448/g.49740  ORF Transcript_25448/g.49740 Transcript_25448/m.49740 type:complete len:122 (+) Transcript_25448:94-459(+)